MNKSAAEGITEVRPGPIEGQPVLPERPGILSRMNNRLNSACDRYPFQTGVVTSAVGVGAASLVAPPLMWVGRKARNIFGGLTRGAAAKAGEGVRQEAERNLVGSAIDIIGGGLSKLR